VPERSHLPGSLEADSTVATLITIFFMSVP